MALTINEVDPDASIGETEDAQFYPQEYVRGKAGARSV